MSYGFIRLLRVIDAERSVVEEDLKKLGEFLKQRATSNKNLSYYVLTYVKRGDVDGYVIVEGGDVDKEIDIIETFINSNLVSVKTQIVRSVSEKTISIPLPRNRNFSENTVA